MGKLEQKIIEETASFYNSLNRGIDKSGSCVYLTDDGKKSCAVGRCMLKTKARNVQGIEELSLTGFDFSDKSLKKKYRGCSHQFWEDLQYFHDYSSNWTGTGISPKGEIEKEKLLEKYI